MAGPSPQTANDLMTVFSNTVSAGFDALNGAVNGVFGLMIVLVVALRREFKNSRCRRTGRPCVRS